MAAHRENPKTTLRERGPRNNSPQAKTREIAEKTRITARNLRPSRRAAKSDLHADFHEK